MARIRLRKDIPGEGKAGDVLVVAPKLAQQWVDEGRAERVIDREPPIERANRR